MSIFPPEINRKIVDELFDGCELGLSMREAATRSARAIEGVSHVSGRGADCLARLVSEDDASHVAEGWHREREESRQDLLEVMQVDSEFLAHGRAILYKTVLITHKTQLAWLDRTLRGALVRQSAPLAELTTTLILALPAYQTDDESIHVLALLLEKLVNLRSVVCTGRGHSGPTDILLRLSVSVTLPRSLVSVTFLPLSMFTRRELCRFLEQVASQLEELSVVTFSRTMEWDKTRVHSSEGLGGEIEIVEGWLRERAEIALLRLRSLKVAAVPGISPPGDEYAEAFLRYLLKTPSNLDSLERLHLPTNSILTVAAASSTTSSTRAPIPLLDPLLLWSASSLREIWLSGPPPSDETIGALTAVDTLTVPYVGFEAYLPIWSGIKDLGLVDTEAPLSLDDSTPKQLDLSLRRLRRFIQKRDKEDGLKGVERLDWMAQLDWRRAT